VGLSKVGLKHRRLSAGTSYRSSCLFRTFNGIVVVNGDAHSLAAKRFRERLTNPSASAGYQRNASRELQFTAAG